MKKVWGVMILVALILAFGTVGAVEIDSISMAQGLVQIAVAFVLGAVGVKKYSIKEENTNE